MSNERRGIVKSPTFKGEKLSTEIKEINICKDIKLEPDPILRFYLALTTDNSKRVLCRNLERNIEKTAFLTDMQDLCSLRHRNLLRYIGFHINPENQQLTMVYFYSLK